MTYHCKTIDLNQLANSCPLVAIYENGELSASAKKLDKLLGGKINDLCKQGTFQAKLGYTFLFPTDSGFALIVGCGEKSKLSPIAFKRIIASSTLILQNASIQNVSCFLTDITPKGCTEAWAVKLITETVSETLYRFDMFKSKKEPLFNFKQYTIAISDTEQKACQTALKQGIAIAKAVTMTKNLANTPSNICTPTFLAEQAKALAKDYAGLKVNILNENEMHKLGMGALLGVSQGSSEEAKLICIHYQGGKKDEKPVVFIGKGVTFDTGGNSLKPPDAMVGMKYDMSGGATVLGVLQASADLELPLNVVGIIPAVENMPGGTAYKPEDILTSMSGQTIEVISTDAEGRLALCDALTYSERFEPDTVIDIATLTGAVVIALGSQATGLLANDDTLAKKLLQASEDSVDRAWQLPLWEEYQEQLKSPFADMANVGGRPAGTITAACFLARFAQKFKWAHLDVAGTAAVMAGQSERKASGRPVPMLMQYLLNRIE